jgi:hypothetical protein
MKTLLCIALVLSCLACGGGSQAPPAETKAETPKPPDESRRFPKENQTAMELIDDHVLGKDFLPGGNLATYEKDGKTYRLFLVAAKDADAASLQLFDIKGALADAKFVPAFGGYFGMDGETPWFVFAKGKYLAGVVGLPQDEADLIARELAARIPAS